MTLLLSITTTPDSDYYTHTNNTPLLLLPSLSNRLLSPRALRTENRQILNISCVYLIQFRSISIPILGNSFERRICILIKVFPPVCPSVRPCLPVFGEQFWLIDSIPKRGILLDWSGCCCRSIGFLLPVSAAAADEAEPQRSASENARVPGPRRIYTIPQKWNWTSIELKPEWIIIITVEHTSINLARCLSIIYLYAYSFSVAAKNIREGGSQHKKCGA